jgi:hypothetical protein
MLTVFMVFLRLLVSLDILYRYNAFKYSCMFLRFKIHLAYFLLDIKKLISYIFQSGTVHTSFDINQSKCSFS